MVLVKQPNPQNFAAMFKVKFSIMTRAYIRHLPNPIMSNVLASRNDRGKIRLYDIRLGSSVGGYEFDWFDVSLITESLMSGFLFSVAGDIGSLQFNESGTLLVAGSNTSNSMNVGIKMIDLRY